MSHPAIRVEGLSKIYRIGLAEQRHESLVSAALDMAKAPLRNFQKLWRLDTLRSGTQQEEEDLIWALRDVSFEVNRGEVLGIIGRNGAGKSTLLKILSRVTSPTMGRAVVDGRISSLLEVGTGFHPELTGRDNIYLNGTILGMTKREIDRKFDEIVEFSGIEKFLDTPIKRYSSGMKVRLAFSVAAHLEPDILIIDEVLAVGDYEFQQKCLGKMESITRGGSDRTVLFVSHNMGMMRSLCDRVVMLKGGQKCFDGPAEDGVAAYEKQFQRRDGQEGHIIIDDDPSLPIQIREVAVTKADGGILSSFSMFEPITLSVRYCVREFVRGANLSLSVSYQGTRLLGSFDTDEVPELLEGREPGEYAAHIRLPTEILKPGNYSVTVASGAFKQGASRQRLEDAISFQILESMDVSLKSFAMKRPFLIATRMNWNTERIDAAVV